jgi:hypothetical protein
MNNEPDPEIVLGPIDETRSSKRLHPNYGRLDLDVYSPKDIAERLGSTQAEILKQIKDHKLKAKRFGGPMGYKITKGDLLSWLNEN